MLLLIKCISAFFCTNGEEEVAFKTLLNTSFNMKYWGMSEGISSFYAIESTSLFK